MQFKRIVFLAIVSLSVPLRGAAQEPVILEYGQAVYTVAFSPVNPSIIAAAGRANNPDDNIIKVWNLEANKAIVLHGHTSNIRSVAFSPNGRWLASGSDDSTFRLWDLSQERNIVTKQYVIDEAAYAVLGVAFSSDGRHLATAGKHLKVWSVPNMEEKFTLRHSEATWVWTLAFSRNGRYIAAGEGNNEGPGRVRVWNLATQKPVVSMDVDPKFVYSVAFSPDNRTLACAGWQGTIKLWNVSDWQLRGTIYRTGTIRSIALSPNSNVLAGGGDSFLGLWSSMTGAALDFMPEGVMGKVKAVAFSNDRHSLASGGSDGRVRIRNIEDELRSVDQAPMVRFIYFVPRDRIPNNDVVSRIDIVIRNVQQFFAEQMEFHGYGRKTFTYNTDVTGKPLVRQVTGRFDAKHYQSDTWEKINQELGSSHQKNIDVIIVDMDERVNRQVCGVGGGSWITDDLGRRSRLRGGRAILATSYPCFNRFVLAHELGHAFGLPHDFRSEHDIMSYGGSQRASLSRCAADWLDRHRYLNPTQPAFNEPTTIEMFTPLLLPPHGVILHFKIDDADGLRHSMLLGSTFGNDPVDEEKLYVCQSLSGETAIIEFAVPKFPMFARNEIKLRVIDIHGNISEQTFSALGAEQVVNTDVNGDGVVNVMDLLFVADRFGQSGQNPADLNGDGVVNISDLLLVADAFRNNPAVPPLKPQTIAVLTTATVKDWLMQAQQMVLTDLVYLRGISVLEQLLAALTPTETALLPNYPNPFNPETWIPYELAAASDVRIAIYDARGTIVRRLDLGQQQAGYFGDKDRAAHWDGRNGSGERVASGLYFYTLTADDFIDTGKMLIGK